ncbi:Tn7 transposase TnsA N-terminal domain-containing protein [Pseudoalteromonas xiamenensis]|uniref:Tn7 transposase TnsA N-terminal domain-containing protein n=1 Tax=Pseudoalteromonas xiamenensis TaxID=882626 RepID=UPI0035EF5AB7
MARRKQARQKFYGSTRVIFDKNLNLVNQPDSKLEADYYVLQRILGAEFIQSQPRELPHFLDGKLVNYTPDFEVIIKGVRYIIEIKYFKDTLNQDFKDKVAFLINEYLKQGAIFKVVTELDVYDGENVNNAYLLLPSLSHPSPVSSFKSLVNGLESRAYSMSEMKSIAIERGIKPIIIRRAIAHGLFSVDLTLRYSQWMLTINKVTH